MNKELIEYQIITKELIENLIGMENQIIIYALENNNKGVIDVAKANIKKLQQVNLP